MSNENETLIRASLNIGGEMIILYCERISQCSILEDHYLFTACKDFTISDEDSDFSVHTFSYKKSSLLEYSIGSIIKEEEEPEEEVEPEEEEPEEEAEPEEEEEDIFGKNIGSFIK